MGFIFRTSTDDSPHKAELKVKNAVVVGGGFIGSSSALALARRGIRVTVLDRRDITKGDIGEATTASWAWLNANDKAPWNYFSLNRLGMKVWNDDPALSNLPVWCGGLVRRRNKPTGQNPTDVEDDPAKGGGYVCIGPLTRDEVLALDPVAEFLGEVPEGAEEISFYADEGHVDPIEATRAMREEASRLGAKFAGNTYVEKILLILRVLCAV